MLTHYAGDMFFQTSGMPLQVVHVSGHPDHLFHDHDFTELVVVTHGRGRHATQTEEYEIGAGDVFVVHPREKHSYRDTEGLAIYNVFFDMDGLRLPLLDIEHSAGYRALFTLEPRLRIAHGFKSWLTLSPGQLAIVCNLLGEIEQELVRQLPGYRGTAGGLFLQVVGYLSRCYSHIEAPHPHALLRIGSVLEYLESSPDKPIRLEDLAHRAGMSRSSFQRAFRRVLNASPVDYWIRLRIERARALLASGTVRIKEAAAAAGFDDSNYFSRQFRHIHGVSPRAYARASSSLPAEPRGPGRRRMGGRR